MDSDALDHRRSGSCVQIVRTSFSCTSAAANARIWGADFCEVPTRSGSNDARASTIASTGSTTSTECVCRGCHRGCQTALGEPFGDLQEPILSVKAGEPAGIRTQDTRIKSLSGQCSQGASGRLPVHAARGLHAWAPPHRTVVHRRGCQRGCHPRREGGTGPQVADSAAANRTIQRVLIRLVTSDRNRSWPHRSSGRRPSESLTPGYRGLGKGRRLRSPHPASGWPSTAVRGHGVSMRAGQGTILPGAPERRQGLRHAREGSYRHG